MNLIKVLNSVNENVWGVLLILTGGGVAVAGIWNHDVFPTAMGIIAAGAMAFKGGAGSPPASA